MTLGHSIVTADARYLDTRERKLTARVTLEVDGFDQWNSMAGDGGYCRGRMVNSFAAKVQKELGILAFSFEQRAVDCLGMARPRLRAGFSTTMSRIS